MDGAGRGAVDPVQHQELEFTSLESVQTSPLNMSPLHLAAVKGEVDILKAPILREDHVVDLSVMDGPHRTPPISRPTTTTYAEVVKAILSTIERIHVDVNTPAMFGITPLHLSIMWRSISVAEVLISFPLVDKMAESEERLSVLHMASDVGRALKVHWLSPSPVILLHGDGSSRFSEVCMMNSLVKICVITTINS